MNTFKQFVILGCCILAGYLAAYSSKDNPAPAATVEVTPAAAPVGPPPDGSLGVPKIDVPPNNPPLRPLTTAEFLDVIQRNYEAWKRWVEKVNPPDELSMRELAELWLAENPQHDPRLPKPKVKAVSVEEPLLTQPQTIARPKAAPVEYVTVQQPYTYSYGFRGRKTGTAYRNVTMTRAQYQAQKAKPTTTYYYGGGCANGRCGR